MDNIINEIQQLIESIGVMKNKLSSDLPISFEVIEQLECLAQRMIEILDMLSTFYPNDDSMVCELLNPIMTSREKIKIVERSNGDYFGMKEKVVQLLKEMYNNLDDVFKTYNYATEKVMPIYHQKRSQYHEIIVNLRATISRNRNTIESLLQYINSPSRAKGFNSFAWASLYIMESQFKDIMQMLNEIKSITEFVKHRIEPVNDKIMRKNLMYRQRVDGIMKFIRTQHGIVEKGETYERKIAGVKETKQKSKFVTSDFAKPIDEGITETMPFYQTYMLNRLQKLNEDIDSFLSVHDVIPTKDTPFMQCLEYLNESEILMARLVAEVICINSFLAVDAASNTKLKNLCNCLSDSFIECEESEELGKAFGWHYFRYLKAWVLGDVLAENTPRRGQIDRGCLEIASEAANAFLDTYINGQCVLKALELSGINEINFDAPEGNIAELLELVAKICYNHIGYSLDGFSKLVDIDKHFWESDKCYVKIGDLYYKAPDIIEALNRMEEMGNQLFDETFELEPEKQEEIIQLLLNATIKILKIRCQNISVENMFIDNTIFGKTVSYQGKSKSSK